MDTRFDFLPPEFLQAKRNRRANRLCATLLVAVASVISVGYAAADRRLRAAEAEHAQTLDAFSTQTLRIAQVRELEKRQIELTRRAELATSLLEKSPRSRLLAEFIQLAPTGTQLIEFTLDARLSAATVAGPNVKAQPRKYETTIRVTGFAAGNAEVATYIRQLDRCAWFEDVRLIVAESLDKRPGGRQFLLQMRLADRGLEQLANVELNK